MGRPPVYRTCPACNQQRMAKEFGGKTARRCIHCRETGRLVPNDDVVRPSQFFTTTPRDVSSHDTHLIFESQKMATATSAKLFEPFKFSVCQCCRAPDLGAFTPGAASTVRVVYGYTLCLVCAYQVERCGRCGMHQSALLVPELAEQHVPMVPVEIINLMSPQAHQDKDSDDEPNTTVPETSAPVALSD